MKFDTSDRVLLHLAQTKDDQALTIIGISRKLDVASTWVSQILRTLQVAQLVDSERRRAGADGRKARCYYVTEAGRQRAALLRQLGGKSNQTS